MDQVEVVGTQSLVDGFTDEGLGDSGDELFDEGQHGVNEVDIENSRQVLVFSIDPTEQEIVVTIWHTFNGLEPFDGSGVVELSSDFLSQGQVSNIETSVLGVLLPVLPAVSLDFLLRPVPGILRFNSLDFTVDF